MGMPADVQYYPNYFRSFDPEGKVTFGPVTQGGQGAGAGGVADPWDPHGGGVSGYGFVISGVPVNHDPVSVTGGAASADTAHYYSGYWAGVQADLYGFTVPAADAAAHAVAYAFAVIGRAVVSSAHANEFESGGGTFDPSRRFLPEISGGGFKPEFESGGGIVDPPPTSGQLGAELSHADALSGPGLAPWWQVRLWEEAVFHPAEFFPYEGETPQANRMIADFFDVNRYEGRGVDPFFTMSGLPTFPVYKQTFGPGTPPLYMGTRSLTLSNEYEYPIFTFGPLIPPDYGE